MLRRNFLRRRALSSAAEDEGLVRQQSSIQVPPLPSPSTVGSFTRHLQGNYSKGEYSNTNNNHSPSNRNKKGKAGLGLSIKLVTPPASPIGLNFSSSPSQTFSPPSFAISKTRHGSLKKCLTTPNISFQMNLVNNLLRWREKKNKQTRVEKRRLHRGDDGEEKGVLEGMDDNILVYPTQSFLEFGSSRDSLQSTSVSRPSDSSLSTSSSSVSAFASNLHPSRSFAVLRQSLAWDSIDPPPHSLPKAVPQPAPLPSVSFPRLYKQYQRSQSTLPPPLPPPNEALPCTPMMSSTETRPSRPSKLSKGLTLQTKTNKANNYSIFTQWERELKEMSDTLYAKERSRALHFQPLSHRQKEKKSSDTGEKDHLSIDRNDSTPSTMTPTVHTPQREAFEFELDNDSLPTPSPSPKRIYSTHSDQLVTSFPHHVPFPPTNVLDTPSQDSVVRSSIASFYTANSKCPLR